MEYKPVPSHSDGARGILDVIYSRFKILNSEVNFSDIEMPVLDPLNPHLLKGPLTEPICHLSANESMRSFSAKASCFLFRKVLPASDDDPVPGYLQKLSDHSGIDPTFHRVARKVVEQLFPVGWDRAYAEMCGNVTVKDSSCTEKGRGKGGSREFAREVFGCHEEFVRVTSTGEGAKFIPPERRVSTILDGPKKRMVTVASGLQSQLLPLHKIMYNNLCRFPWLLRGDAGLSVLAGMKRSSSAKDEVFVSGDYEAATDHLAASHSKLLLRLIQKQSRFVPSSIWHVAIDSMTGRLNAVVDGVKVIADQNNGQMMGNYLSFPLLCLTNYIGVAMAIGVKGTKNLSREGLLKINGDDLVFRASPEDYSRWATCVKSAGFKLSVGKTLVHKRLFSINSTFFCARMEKPPKLVPVIRSSTIYDRNTMLGVAGIMKSACWGYQGTRRSRVQAEILRWHHRAVEETRFGLGGPCCSISRGMGVDIGLEALQKGSGPVRYLKREWHIRRLPAQMDQLPFQERRLKDGSWVRLEERIPFHPHSAAGFSDADREFFGEKFRDWSVKRTWERPEYFKIEPEDLRERSLLIWKTDSWISRRFRVVRPGNGLFRGVQLSISRSDKIRLKSMLGRATLKDRIMVPEGYEDLRKPINKGWVPASLSLAKRTKI